LNLWCDILNDVFIFVYIKKKYESECVRCKIKMELFIGRENKLLLCWYLMHRTTAHKGHIFRYFRTHYIQAELYYLAIKYQHNNNLFSLPINSSILILWNCPLLSVICHIQVPFKAGLTCWALLHFILKVDSQSHKLIY
jgi:hypothetical protein